MQSLVLATSLLLSSQSPVIATDVAQEVASFVQSETARVTQFVNSKELKAIKGALLSEANIDVRKDSLAQESTTTLIAAVE